MEKNFMINLLIFLILFTPPTFALCPIDSGESVCSADFKHNTTSIFQNKNYESNLGDTHSPLQPLQKENLFDKTRMPNNELMQYDSGCQFGNCVQNLKENLPSKQGQ